MDQKKIGEFLKALRTEKGLTQQQLAEKFNVAGRTVSRWETGRNMPDISLLVDIADFYEIDVRELMEGERRIGVNEEIKEVAVKMADYATQEKGRLLGIVRVIGFAGVGLLTLAIVLQCLNYEPDLRRSGAIAATFIGLIAMAAVTLYANGVLGGLVKKRGFIIATRVIMICLIVIVSRFIIATALVTGIALFDFYKPFKTVSGVENYDKEAIVRENSADMDSLMLVFPDSAEKAINASFDSQTKVGLFDTDGYFILRAEYNEDDFENEVTRLSEISCTVRANSFKDAEEYIGYIRYDEDTYNYPAYIAADGYDYVYEYALLDGESHTIIYVLLSYPDYEKLDKYREYLKKEPLEYNISNGNVLENFTIYAHSFDGGSSWSEATDHLYP